MLPIYQAESFRRVLDKGGRTKPWLVLVRTEEGTMPYVVKLFEPDAIAGRDAVANEVLGNVLAREFQLPVPKAALIEFSDTFLATVGDPALLDVLGRADDRLKFGSALLDGFTRFDPTTFTAAEARRIIDIDSVFAFDNLIRNPDRKAIKPNLLVRSQEGYLIDHELGFEIDQATISELEKRTWPGKFYNWHIFHSYLKTAPVKQKAGFFNEFEEYLRLLNLNVLRPYLRQLEQIGYPTIKHSLILEYLYYCKRNSATFAMVLKSLII